jgi:hypothetical protein
MAARSLKLNECCGVNFLRRGGCRPLRPELPTSGPRGKLCRATSREVRLQPGKLPRQFLAVSGRHSRFRVSDLAQTRHNWRD